jgi:rhodanese-related sulfurtransferase
MDRWWPDGTETGSRLWGGMVAIVVAGCLLGVMQNVLVRAGNPKAGLAWSYVPPTLDALPDAPATAPAAPADGSTGTLPPDMNDPLGLGAASSGTFDVPDVDRPLQIQLSRVKQFLDADAATFVDARDPAEYAEGHIPGAVNMPYDQVVTDPVKLEAFDPKGKPIIIYCGGGTCELSMNLAFSLIGAGKHKVLVFMGGWPEWTSAGYPVAKGATPAGA